MEKELEYYYAIKDNDFEKFKTLAGHQYEICKKIRPYDQSLLLHAVLNDAYKIAAFLLTQNCNVNEADKKGYTPLHAAAEYGKLKMAALLIKNKAHIDQEDHFGNTPLMSAVFNNTPNDEIIKLLLKNGAIPFHKNKSGISPYDFVVTSGKKSIIEIFKKNKDGKII